MIIHLYNNESAPNVINKNITLVATLEGALRGETNLVAPIVRIVSDGFPAFNYAHIPAYGRFYYLQDIQTVRTGVYDISLKSDPLKSFDLNDVVGVVTEAQNVGNKYLEHRHFVRSVKTKTNVVAFSSGLLDSGEYILITAGGGSGS